MKQSARTQASLEILEKIAEKRIPMDNVIRDYMTYKRYIGSKDRADIVERVYRMARHQARYGWMLEQLNTPDTPRARVLIDLLWHSEVPQHLFTGEKYAPDALSEEEQALIGRFTAIDKSAMPETIAVECPPWAEDKLRDLYGDHFAEELRAMLIPATLDLRVNTLLGSVDEIRSSLAAQDVETDRGQFSPYALRAKRKTFMSNTKAFNKGQVEIQDEGSQLIALLTGAQPGMRVLDFCAGGGGKTLAIAALMNNKGNIVAMDIDRRRLEKGKSRYRKAGIHNVEMRCLEDEQHRKWLRRQKETMDVVLVDAPCSSSGTWRRNPDLRWHWYGPSLAEITAMQAEILEKVADKVKPGGRLVYATCSLFREENEDQVEAFLKNHPEFEVAPISTLWPVPGKTPPCPDPYLRLSPAAHETDGFFTAVLMKK